MEYKVYVRKKGLKRWLVKGGRTYGGYKTLKDAKSATFKTKKYEFKIRRVGK